MSRFDSKKNNSLNNKDILAFYGILSIFLVFAVSVCFTCCFTDQSAGTAIACQPPQPTFTPTPCDTDNDGISDPNDGDMDGDGTPNWCDDDIDGDGTKNDQDTDDDNDGTPDSSDDTPGGYGTDQSHYPSPWGGGCSSCSTPTSMPTPTQTPTPVPTSTPIGGISVSVTTFNYFRTCQIVEPSYEPLIIANDDHIYYKFALQISPTNSSVLQFNKVTVSLNQGTTVKAFKEWTSTSKHYPSLNIIADNASYDNMEPLLFSNLDDNTEYQFKVSVVVDNNGTLQTYNTVLSKRCTSNFQAVEVARTITNEDNNGNTARSLVADSFLSRWNFPNISNGHFFLRSNLVDNNSSIYDLCRDTRIYVGARKAFLKDVVQHSRILGKKVLDNPNLSNGNGPINFYKVGAIVGPAVDNCRDCTNVGLYRKLATFGNYYYGPASNCQSWTATFLENKYDQNPNDTLEW